MTENLPSNTPQTQQFPNPHALTLFCGPVALKTSSFLPLLTPLPLHRMKRHFERGDGSGILGCRC